ncbi:MAG: DUF222 domain-containing protein [Actinomycetota bacterium]|nr:DUF222 domain-containing protein [Actinomycetota bacterium]
MTSTPDILSGTVGDLLAFVASMEPGPFAQSILLGIDAMTLSPEDALAYTREHRRVASWWASLETRALVAAASGHRRVEEILVLDPVSDSERTVRIADAVREEIAAALRLSPVTAQQRIDTARLLAGPLRATHAALAAGEVSPSHVSVIVEAAARLDGVWEADGPNADTFRESCAALEARVLPVARRSTPGMTRAAARRAVLVVDPHGARRRRQAARCTRDVRVIDEPDGTAVLLARMATVDAHAILAAVNHHAAQVDAPTVGEARAQALADLVLGRDETRTEPGQAPLGVHLDVVIDLATLLRLREDPATLHGSGPIAADEVRDLIAGLPAEAALTIRRLVADPITGHLLDAGRRTYRIPGHLRAFITARDHTCRFPGCARRADRCQVDHATPWDDHGTTSPANLGALCTRHHQLKTHAGWQITQSAADGSCTWHSPMGHTYPHAPPDIRGSG